MFYGDFMHYELANNYNFSDDYNYFPFRVKNLERSGWNTILPNVD
jgi:hypothetical protein